MLPVIQPAPTGRNNREASGGSTQPLSPFEPSFELPKLHEAELDWDGVDCVLADLDDFAELLKLQARGTKGQQFDLQDLVIARDQFVAGELQALQILYRFADQVWIDTLLRQANGARLVRMISTRE